jgi:catechol 2,3-dioxygenase-like lactoylglutathione lyase family enzyme
VFKSTYGTLYYVDQMQEAVSFYRSKLGMAPTYESDGWTEFDIGGHRVCLHHKESGKTYRENGVLIFNFEGVKNLFENMKRDGLNVSALHEVHPGHWTFHVNDNSNNELSVFGPA